MVQWTTQTPGPWCYCTYCISDSNTAVNRCTVFQLGGGLLGYDLGYAYSHAIKKIQSPSTLYTNKNNTTNVPLLLLGVSTSVW